MPSPKVNAASVRVSQALREHLRWLLKFDRVVVLGVALHDFAQRYSTRCPPQTQVHLSSAGSRPHCHRCLARSSFAAHRPRPSRTSATSGNHCVSFPVRVPPNAQSSRARRTCYAAAKNTRAKRFPTGVSVACVGGGGNREHNGCGATSMRGALQSLGSWTPHFQVPNSFVSAPGTFG